MKLDSILATIVAAMLALGGMSQVDAAANDIGWYAGISAGQARYHDLDKDDFDDDLIFLFEDFGFTVVGGTSSLKTNDTSWSLFGGYNFTQHLGVEVGYHQLGAAKYDASGTVSFFGVTETVSMGAKVEARGFTAAGVGRISVGNNVELRALAGVLVADADVSIRVAIDDVFEQEKFSEDSTDLFVGLGAAYSFGNNWSLGADYRFFRKVGGEIDISTLSVGLSYRF